MYNILFLSNVSPFTLQSGASQRTNLLCRSLSQFAYIDVLSIEQDLEFNINNCTMIKIESYSNNNNIYITINSLFKLFFPPLFFKIINFFLVFTKSVLGQKDLYLSKIAKRLIKEKKYDFIFVRYIESLLVFGIKPAKNVIIDLDDLPQQVFLSNIEMCKNDYLLKKIYYKLFFSIAVKTSKYYTGKIVKKVFAVYLPNEKQCSLFNNSFYLPNIYYPFNLTESSQVSESQILFVGFMNYKPNFVGVEYFLDNIYPSILNKIPYIKFKIIGKIKEELKKKWLLRYKNIYVTGFVDNLEKEYKKSSVVVIPVYHGSGTNIKVIEAMNYEKACVISSFAAKGFENLLKNEENILIADNDNDFIKMIIKLLEDKEYRKTIEKAAKKAVDKQYSFENFSEIIKKTIISSPIN